MLLWTWECIYLFWVSVFISFGYIPRSRIAGSYGSSIFNFLRILHTVFHMAIPVYSPTNSAQGFSHHILPSIFYRRVFSLMAILKGRRWYLIVVVICISLMTNDVEHLFMYLLAFCMCSLEKCRGQVYENFLSVVP